MAKEKCKISLPNKELQSLHHLLYHGHSSETLKHLSLVKYGTSKIKETNSFIGSREKFAIIRLIVRLYPYLRSFKIPVFDPYLASITLFNNANITCSYLDRILMSLSLSEIETRETVEDGVQQPQGKSDINDASFHSSSLTINIPSPVELQADSQPCCEILASSSKAYSAPSSATANLHQIDVTTTTTSNQRPLLLSMPLLTDLQPTTSTDQFPLSCSDIVDNAEVTVDNLTQSTDDSEITSLPEVTSTGVTNLQEPFNNMLMDGNATSTNSLCGDNINDMSELSSSTGNVVSSGNLDSDNSTLLFDDILNLTNDPDCVRDLMDNVELSFLLPSDFLEPSSTDWTNSAVPDNDNIVCLSNESSDISNFAHLSNPLADLTFESLSAIPDSILESTLQMMIENSHTSSDIVVHTTTAMDTNKSFASSSSVAKGKSSSNVNNKRGSSATNSVSFASQKRKKALQLAKV